MNLNPFRYLRSPSLNDHNKKVFNVLLRRQVLEFFIGAVILLIGFSEVSSNRYPTFSILAVAIFVLGHIVPFYVRDRALKRIESWKLKRATRRDVTRLRVHIRD